MGRLHDGLRAVQMGFNAPKTRYNKFGDYHYRNAEDMEAGLKPLLDEQGLTMVIDDEVVNIGPRFYIKATVTVTDGEDSVVAHGWAREVETKTKSDPAQITGMASSYARKYALGGLFLVDDQPDADSQDNAQATTKPQGPTDHVAADPQREELERAAKRLTDAVEAYCKAHGGDAEQVKASIKARADFVNSASFYNKVAYEYEQSNG